MVSHQISNRRRQVLIHNLCKANRTRAAREILILSIRLHEHLSLGDLDDYWGKIFTEISISSLTGGMTKSRLDALLVSATECSRVHSRFAPGLDGFSASLWNSVPPQLQAIFCNVVLSLESLRLHLCLSRTIFIPN